MSDHVCVGAVAGAFGVRGEVRLKSFTTEPADIASYGPLSTASGEYRFQVHLGRQIKGGFAARLTGVKTKEDADALKGTRLYVPRERLPDLSDDEYYHADLIGLEVFDTGGVRIGRVIAVHDNGAGDLLEVGGAGRSSTLLFPFTRAVVPTVNIAAGRIVADPPDGLM